jgi:hypothetical protein
MYYVLAASYERVDDALADYEAIDGAYRHFAKSHEFDATDRRQGRGGKGGHRAQARRADAPPHGEIRLGHRRGRRRRAVPSIGILGALAARGAPGRRWAPWRAMPPAR